jgi:hypothetical protein
MPGPSLQDIGTTPETLGEAEAAAVDAQLKAWFDAMLRAPVPAYLMRHVGEAQRQAGLQEALVLVGGLGQGLGHQGVHGAVGLHQLQQSASARGSRGS